MENMTIGLSTTFIGMAIVFAVLCLLAGILYLFKGMFGGKDGAKANLSAKKAVPAEIATHPPVLSQPAVLSAPAKQDETEIIAAISAAIASCMDARPDQIIIRSYRRVPNWSGAAVRESMK